MKSPIFSHTELQTDAETNKFSLQPRGDRKNFFAIFLSWVMLSTVSFYFWPWIGISIANALYIQFRFESPFVIQLMQGILGGLFVAFVALFQSILLYRIATRSWLWPLVSGFAAILSNAIFGATPLVMVMMSLSLAVAQAVIIYPISRCGFRGGIYWVCAMITGSLILQVPGVTTGITHLIAPGTISQVFVLTFILDSFKFLCTGLLIAYWASRPASRPALSPHPNSL